MGISKKERRLSIWLGVSIGIAFSSLLVRYAINHKEKKALERPGHYDSNLTASSGIPFHPVPQFVRESLPRGLVIYYEHNKSVAKQDGQIYHKWTIESAGSFRSERLFVLIEHSLSHPNIFNFFRASELYLSTDSSVTQKALENQLDSKNSKILGKNAKSGEWIVQIREFSPGKIKAAIETFKKIDLVSKVRLIPWNPPNKS